MKKLFGVIVIILSLIANASPVRAVNLDNYTISSYDVQMTLGRDADNRSTLKTVETITAQFPEYDQNHGVTRGFVKEYNGHSTSFQLVSVQDETGVSLPYNWSGNTLRIGEANTFVHGEKTYVITYTQRDVTRYYADNGRDEFYWDVIGASWRIPIEKAHVVLSVEGSLGSSITKPYCYEGVERTGTLCQMQPQETGTYTTDVTGLGSGKGLTISAGFPQGTFAPYPATLFEKLYGVWNIIQIASFAVMGGFVAWASARWSKLTRKRRKDLGTIVPEYLPPADTSVTTSAKVGQYRSSVMSAQLIDLAVRHYIKIYQVKDKSLFTIGEYEIEVVKDIGDLKWEEQELLKDSFGTTPTVGSRLNLKTLRNNRQYFARTLNNTSDLDKLIRGVYGIEELNEGLKKWLRRVALILLIAGLLTLSLALLIGSSFVFIMSFVSYRLTDKGLALKRYLEGLKLYIKTAEADRLKMLQSPEGAEKVASVTGGSTDGAQLVKLYERVLPYAILFGQEKEWNKQIGAFYETSGSQPDWYSGHNGVFSAAAFSSSMSNFSASTANTSSASSSTGGSTGGGYVGGGGGGGGGGGW